ncbi:hypothetical protein HFP72_12750 [Nocardiopsis sp. ARC36]
MKRVTPELLNTPEDEQGITHLDGFPFTGEVAITREDGRTEIRTLLEGLEDGPVLICTEDGKLVIQGMRRHPHGPVGPWHEWDEEGRLLRETVYDALGNRVLHRELDSHGNIVRQERFEPRTLLQSPETGEEHPAPWL